MVRIAAVIVTHNRLEKLKKAINSLLSQSYNLSQIFIVNNQSTDGTGDFLAKLATENPLITIITSEKNLGGAGGFNLGLSAVQKGDFDWVSIADDDAVYDHDYMATMVKSINQNPGVGCFTGTVFEDNKIGIEHRIHIDDLSKLMLSKLPISNYKENFKVDIATFVGVFLNCKVLNQIGLPRADFFIWYDDIEYSLRIRKETEIINVINAKIYHLTDNNSTGQSGVKRPLTWKDYYGYRNRWVTMSLYCPDSRILQHKLRYEHFRYLIGALMKRKATLSKTASFKLVQAAYHDFKDANMGPNKNYLP